MTIKPSLIKTPTGQVALAATVMSLSVLGDSMLYGVLPSRINDFGLVAGLGVGLILSVNRWVRLVSNTWAASISRRFGLKKPFLFSLLLAVTTTAAYGLFQGFWPLLIARIGWGICFSIQLVTMYMVILQKNASHRGKYMGLFNAILRSGSLFAVLVGGLLADLIGIRAGFLVFAAMVVCNLPLVVFLDEQQHFPYLVQATGNSNNEIPESKNSLLNKRMWSLFLGTSEITKNNKLRLLSLNYLRFTNSFAVSGLLVATLGFLIRERFGASIDTVGITLGAATLTGFILGTSWASEVLLSIYFGQISDKVGPEKLLRLCVPIITIGTLLIIINNPLPMVLGIPVIFIATTGNKVALDSSVGDIASLAHRADVMGRYATWTDLGAALGPLVGYGMIQFFSLSWAYLNTTILLASGLLYYHFTNRKFS